MIRQIAAVLLLAAALVAQERQPPPPPPPPPAVQTTYVLEYTVSELEGTRKVRSRNYTVQVNDRSEGRLRVGSRVPLVTGEQVQYMDVGVNIDARPISVDSRSVRLNTKLEVTAMASTDSSRRPILRNMTSWGETVIPLDKPVILSSQDEPGTETTFQVQVIARIVK